MDYATMTPTNFGIDKGEETMNDIQTEINLGDTLTDVLLENLGNERYGSDYKIQNVNRIIGALLMFRPEKTQERLKELEKDKVREGE